MFREHHTHRVTFLSFYSFQNIYFTQFYFLNKKLLFMDKKFPIFHCLKIIVILINHHKDASF
jgi:hypothetical protein